MAAHEGEHAFSLLCVLGDACKEGDTNIVRQLLRERVPAPVVDDGALGVAADNGLRGVLHALLGARGVPRFPAAVCRRIFYDACCTGKVSVVHEFLMLEDGRHMRPEDLLSGFRAAFTHGHVPLMRLLAERQAIGPGAVTVDDVMHALLQGHADAMMQLLRVVGSPLSLRHVDVSITFTLPSHDAQEDRIDVVADANGLRAVDVNDTQACFFLHACIDGYAHELECVQKSCDREAITPDILEIGFWLAWCSGSIETVAHIATAWKTCHVSSCAWHAYLLLQACKEGDMQRVHTYLAHVKRSGRMLATILSVVFQAACYFEQVNVLRTLLAGRGALRVCRASSVAVLQDVVEIVRDTCREAWEPLVDSQALDAVQAHEPDALVQVSKTLGHIAAREIAWERRWNMVALRQVVRG